MGIGYFNFLGAQSTGDSLSIRIYLEGSLMSNGNKVGPDGRPLMRDNLRYSPFTLQTYIPSISPYSTDELYTNSPNRFKAVGPQANNITSPETVLNVSDHNAIVDWVFVEVRDPSDNTVVMASRSGLLQRDGDIVDVDGQSKLYFPSLESQTGYIVVKHRNHLGVMSQLRDLSLLCDFTSPMTATWDFGTIDQFDYTGMAQKRTVKPGYMALWGGDFDANGKIKLGNPGDDLNSLFVGVLLHPSNANNNINFDSGYGYHAMDFDMNSKAKFDNPNDDRNMQYAQIITYPLNQMLLENYNHFIEQVPQILVE